MNVSHIIPRVKGILLSPKREWGTIDEETPTLGQLYAGYILVLAAVPAVSNFISRSIVGQQIPFVGRVRIGVGAGLTSALAGYVFSLVQIYLLALIVDALAPTFGGRKDRRQALKVVAFSFTAVWVAGAATMIPWLGVLIIFAGSAYSIYLLALGLPRLMHCPADKAAGYTAVSVVAGIVLTLVSVALVGGIAAVGTPRSAWLGDNAGDVKFDKDSPLGQLGAFTKGMEKVKKTLEASDAIESVPPAVLKGFVPRTLLGLPRTKVSASRSGPEGMNTAKAAATFSNGEGRVITLEIADAGSTQGLVALAAAFASEEESEDEDGYVKKYKKDGRIFREAWRKSGHGEYEVVVATRFSVTLAGDVKHISVLKNALDELDLGALEALGK